MILEPNCFNCALDASKVKSLGNENNPDVMIIQDYPNEQDVVKKDELMGTGHKVLKKVLDGYGIRDYYHTFTMLCRPSSKELFPSGLKNCKGRLLSEIGFVNPKKILLLGDITTKHLLDTPLSKLEGRYIDFNGIPTLCTFSTRELIQSPALYRDFATTIYKLKKEPNQYPFRDDWEYMYEPSLEPFERAKEKVLSIDIEFYGDNPRVGLVHSIGINLRNQKVYIIPAATCMQTDKMQTFFEALKLRGFKYIAYHAETEYSWIKGKYNVELDIADDPMFLHYVSDERGGMESDTRKIKGNRKLKTVVSKIYDCEDWSIDLKNVFALPEKEVHDYLCKDVEANWLAYDYTKEQVLAEYKQYPKFYTDVMLPGIPYISKINNQKVFVDVPYLQQLKVEYDESLEKQLSNLRNIVGNDKFNPNSPIDVPNYFFNELGLPRIKGNSVDESVYSTLAERFPDIKFLKLFAKYKKDSKLSSTYITGFINRLDDEDFIESQFTMVNTVTGRLASFDPNWQNIPRDSFIRKIFIAPEGFDFVSLDYAQLEFRVLAELIQDEKTIEFIKSGKDIHRFVASLIFHKPESEITKDERSYAKMRVFGRQYNETDKGVAYKDKVSVSEAERRREIIDDTLPGIKMFIDFSINFVNEYSYSQSPLGRRRRFPLITSKNRKEVHRQAINSPPQGHGSDICWERLCYIDSLEKYRNVALPLGPVHDSGLFYIDKKYTAEVVPELREIMEDTPFRKNMHYAVEAEVGPSWGELHVY